MVVEVVNSLSEGAHDVYGPTDLGGDLEEDGLAL